MSRRRVPPAIPPDDVAIIHTLRRDKRVVRDLRVNKPRGALWVEGTDSETERAYFAAHRERGYDFRFVATPTATDGRPAWYWEQRRSPWAHRARPQREMQLLAGAIIETLADERLDNRRLLNLVCDEVAARIREGGDTQTLRRFSVAVRALARRLARTQQPTKRADVIDMIAAGLGSADRIEPVTYRPRDSGRSPKHE